VGREPFGRHANRPDDGRLHPFLLFYRILSGQMVGTRGVFITIFIILGVVGGAVTVYRQILKTLNEQPPNKNDTINGSQ
jgi:F0F1-type ATP synthase assembly protein I